MYWGIELNIKDLIKKALPKLKKGYHYDFRSKWAGYDLDIINEETGKRLDSFISEKGEFNTHWQKTLIKLDWESDNKTPLKSLRYSINGKEVKPFKEK